MISGALFAKSLILLRPWGGEFIVRGVIYAGSDFMTDSFVSIVIRAEMLPAQCT
jgi:hypothetical protein